eukprot:4638804-Pleurochrysis_carterae.AAC.1
MDGDSSRRFIKTDQAEVTKRKYERKGQNKKGRGEIAPRAPNRVNTGGRVESEWQRRGRGWEGNGGKKCQKGKQRQMTDLEHQLKSRNTGAAYTLDEKESRQRSRQGGGSGAGGGRKNRNLGARARPLPLLSRTPTLPCAPPHADTARKEVPRGTSCRAHRRVRACAPTSALSRRTSRASQLRGT